MTDRPGLPNRTRQLMRVLFVDDEPMVLAGLTDLLRGQYRVATATSGAEALRLIVESEPFSVIVSDFAMPGMSGAEFLAQARHAAPDAIRLLLTGQATLEGAAAAVNEGQIFRILLKPCSGKHLIQALDDAVEQYRLVTGDRQLLEHKLAAMSGHLVRAERLASLGTMAAAVGHELTNILTGFTGALGLIEEDIANGVVPDRGTMVILRHTQEQLILHGRNLLQFGTPSKAAAEATDLKECLHSVLNMLRLGGRLRQVQVALDLPVQPIDVAIEPDAAEQMLLNVIKNAVEAMGGKPDPRLDITLAREADGTVTCRIADNGCGIAAAHLPLLFEPYFTTKPPDSGTGLGLFVVRDVLKKAGGKVDVQSTLGTGTVFTLSMPLLGQAPAPAASTPASGKEAA